MFKRREGTAGISGHLFETKLLSLLYFRAIHDDRIKKFQLASNVDNMGAFDDICFHAEVEDFDKPVLVFVQAKHRENKKQTLKIDLATYFTSYLEITQQFSEANKDLFFKGKFDEKECLFVLYTTARDEFRNEFKVESGVFSILNDLIGTDGTAKQPYKVDEDQNPQTQTIDCLCEVAMKEHMISLAERMAKFINDDGNFQMMLTDELIQRYHVILAQKVVEVSEIKPEGHRIAFFRQDFFGIDGVYLTLFKDTLIKQILMKRKIKSSDAKKILAEFLNNPSDASILSKLVGTVIPCNNDQLVFDNKYTNDFRPDMKAIDVPKSTIEKAVELAAKEILLSPKFKLRVPAAFGNKDLTLSGSDDKKKKRIKYLSSKITDLLDKCSSSGIVTIDETLEDGLLKLSGGIAGAIGNILVLDDDTKLMKITTDVDSLGPLAKNLYEHLNEDIEMFNKKNENNKIPSLSEYKFRSKVNKLPKLLLECSENEEDAKNFLNKLVIYSNQANEEDVEDILKSEIEENQLNQPNYLQVHTDAIFSKYHDEMLKWWKLPEQAPILTRKDDYFQRAKQSIIKDPLLSIVTAMYHNKIKPMNFAFTEDAVNSLNLRNPPSNTLIISENSKLTVVKVLQHLKKIDHVVLDMEYIAGLPLNDRSVLLKELREMNVAKVVILVCDVVQKDTSKIIETVVKAVLDKTTFAVANNGSVKILQKYFANPPVHDYKNSLVDMCEDSQKSILASARVLFQDREVSLGLIVDEKSKRYVKDHVLRKLMSEEIIAVGKLIVKENYHDMESFYVDRHLRKFGDDIDMFVNTFDNIPDDIVFVTAEPGMGKSTLLTRLSVNTKELKPDMWIVRINLLEYSREFNKWNEENSVIDILETIKFLCQVILRDKLGKENKIEFTLEEKDNVVYLKHCTVDPLIELELNLFLHFYRERDIIFLFDGFDEICPHYRHVVLKCLKCLRDHHKQRMWITSRSYNKIKTILQQEFGQPYEIVNFTYKQVKYYLANIWNYYLNFKILNHTQLENVNKFIDYMRDKGCRGIPLLGPLNTVFQIAMTYLYYESANLCFLYDLYNINDPFYEQKCDVSPLFLYLSALYVKDKIENKHIEEWYLDVDTFNIYRSFLERKIKRRYIEKNEMDIHYPDIIRAYEKEVADSIIKHKKLGAFAIFSEFNPPLFSRNDLDEIKEMIKELEKGEDKTGLIDSVANGIPIFIHKTLTENFAVEFVCDRLKMGSKREKLDCINILMSGDGFTEERKIFDKKLKMDKKLMSILEDNKDAIFDWIKKHSHIYDVYSPFGPMVLVSSVYEQLNNIDSFIEDTIIYGINNCVISHSDIKEMSKMLRLRELARRLRNLFQYGTEFDIKLFFNDKGFTIILINFQDVVSRSHIRLVIDILIKFETLTRRSWTNPSKRSNLWNCYYFNTCCRTYILLQTPQKILRKPRPPSFTTSFRPRYREPSRPSRPSRNKLTGNQLTGNQFVPRVIHELTVNTPCDLYTTLFQQSLRKTKTVRKIPKLSSRPRCRGPSLRLSQAAPRKSENQRSVVTPGNSTPQESRRETRILRKPRPPSFRTHCRVQSRRPRQSAPRKSENQSEFISVLCFGFSKGPTQTGFIIQPDGQTD